MTDGPQQRNEQPGADDEFAPKPGQPTLPFRAVTPPPHPGYGYPPRDPAAAPEAQQSGYGFPQQPQGQPQSGYGFPQQPQGQPQGDGGHQAPWTPPSAPIGGAGHGGEPDWAALAERNQQGGKRRRTFLIGGGVLAAAAIAAIVGTAVVVSGGKKPHPAPTAAPTVPSVVEPSPSFSAVSPSPAPDPLAVISNAKTDTAPLTAAGLFPGTRVTFPGRAYTKTALSSTTACAAAGGGGLPAVLEHYGCREMLRATYVRGGTAVTVGVAVFQTKAQADAVKAAAGPYLRPLAGGGVGYAFCHATSCQSAIYSVGRYAYFTIGGDVDGTPVTEADKPTATAAQDIATFAFRSLVARGQRAANGG